MRGLGAQVVLSLSKGVPRRWVTSNKSSRAFLLFVTGYLLLRLLCLVVPVVRVDARGGPVGVEVAADVNAEVPQPRLAQSEPYGVTGQQQVGHLYRKALLDILEHGF